MLVISANKSRRNYLDRIYYGNGDKQFYIENATLLNETNYRALRVLYLASSVFCFIQFLYSLQSNVNRNAYLIYGITCIFSIIGMILVEHVVKNHLEYVNVAYYFIAFVLFLETGFSGTVVYQGLPAVNFFIFLVVIPAVFIDKPGNSMVVALSATLLFCAQVVVMKQAYPDVLQVDLQHAAFACAISIIFMMYIRNLHIKDICSKIQFEEKSRTDGLTNVSCKIYAEQLCKEYLQERENTSNCALLVLDVDDFKVINDTYGHPQGDMVLESIARILKTTFRSRDIIGRIGGDEFIILMKDLERMDVAKIKAKYVVGKVSELTKQLNIRQLSCSIGVYYECGNTHTYEQMIEKADAILYKAKKAGKGRVEIMSEVIRRN